MVPCLIDIAGRLLQLCRHAKKRGLDSTYLYMYLTDRSTSEVELHRVDIHKHSSYTKLLLHSEHSQVIQDDQIRHNSVLNAHTNNNTSAPPPLLPRLKPPLHHPPTIENPLSSSLLT